MNNRGTTEAQTELRIHITRFTIHNNGTPTLKGQKSYNIINAYPSHCDATDSNLDTIIMCLPVSCHG